MDKIKKQLSLADIYGEWKEIDFERTLVLKSKETWYKPFSELTNAEIAMLLRQKFGVEYVLPIARQRINEGYEDGSERFEGEIQSIVKAFDEGENLL